MHTRRPFHPDRTAGPTRRPRRPRWLLLLALVATVLWLDAPAGTAAGESWSVTGINEVGCMDQQWEVGLVTRGVDGGSYCHHTVVTAGGKVYMNELQQGVASDGDTYEWGLYAVQSGGPTTGTWPIPAGQPFKAVFTLERPAGTVVSSWTLVTESCDSATILFNGPTSTDLDEDFVKTPTDLCPTLKAFRTNGCPLRDRTLTARAKTGPSRVVGKLVAAHPALYAGRTVTVWRARPGPDRKVATRTTDSVGRFKARVRHGRYYATAPALVVPTAGQVTADRSTTIRVP